MYTISRLAKKFGLSRSTLLYYDSIGLLRADKRTGTGYRQYSEGSALRLSMICELRETGLGIKTIREILSNPRSRKAKALRSRLDQINREISTLREQQQVIVNMLKDKNISRNARLVTKEDWVKFFRSAGLDEDGMRKWHTAFEASLPECHQDFLESFGLPPGDIKKIRELSRR